LITVQQGFQGILACFTYDYLFSSAAEIGKGIFDGVGHIKALTGAIMLSGVAECWDESVSELPAIW
jgi:hypothetical protein